MKFRVLLLVMVLATFQMIYAQEMPAAWSVKGTVIDSASTKPVDFVTIALKKPGGEPVKTVLTKGDGTFLLEKIAPASYKIVIASVGYTSKTINAEVKDGALDLGRIIIAASLTTLKEAVVTADRPLIKQEVDRITYDIQADPENKINTVLDMMRKVPLLSVDGEENIRLNGNSNYKILINGKPSSMVSRSPKDVLRSMPASSIQKIEVITTPPAKYDSEGIAGIINIITNKKIDDGYNGSINTRMSYPTGGPGGGGSFTVKRGKFGTSGYGGIGIYRQPQTTSASSRLSTGPVITGLQQGGTRKSSNSNTYFGSEISYEIDTLNLLTGEVSFFGGGYDSEEHRLSALNNQFNALIQGYQLDSDNENSWGGLDLGINYQKGFKNKKDRLLTFSYKYNNSNDDQFNQLLLSGRVNYSVPDYVQTNEGNSRDQTIQLDYVHPVKKLNIEAGLKGILRDNSSNFESLYKSTNGEYLPDPAQTNTFDNHQNVIGAYNSYQYNTKNWGFKGGVRIEETIIDADFISSATLVKQNYFNVIPTVSLNRKFKDMSSVNLGYTQRIQRPSIYNLNPFVNRSNPSFEYTGNPDLIPVVSNNIDLKYNKFKKGSFNIGLNFSFANNTVQQVALFDAVTNITRTTYQNIGKDRTLGTNFSINYPFTKKWNFNISGNLSYLWIEGIVNGRLEKNSGTRGSFYGGTGYKFEKGWRINANFSYSSPYITLQGKSTAWPYSSFSLNKDIIKDKLSFAASTSNPFGKYRSYENVTSGVNFTQTTQFQNYWRSYSVSLNYRFGKLQEQIKKNKRGINNDDVAGKSSGNQ